jgi:hypothetical protein
MNKRNLSLSLIFLISITYFSIILPETSAFVNFAAASREDNYATINLGTITIFGNTYTPSGGAFWIGITGTHSITYNPAPDYVFVQWVVNDPALTVSNPYSRSTTITIPAEDGFYIVTAIYRYSPPKLHPYLVGGELFTTNKLVVLSPYLALFGIIAVSLSVYISRKRYRD